MAASGEPDLKQIQSEAEVLGRLIQSEQKLAEFFTGVISKSVMDQLEKRHSARLRLYGLLALVLIGVLIPAAGVSIRSMIAQETEQAAEARFATAVQRMETRLQAFLDRELAYSSLVGTVLSLSQRPDVTRAELESLVDRLREVAGQPALTARPELPHLMELVVKIAIASGARRALATLESDHQGVLIASAATVARLARYHGERVVGGHFISRPQLEAAVETFQRYMDRVYDEGDSERLVPLHMMVMRRLSEEAADQMQAIQRRVLELEPARQAEVVYHTVRYTNPVFWRSGEGPGDTSRPLETASHFARNRRIAHAAGHLVDDHRVFYTTMLDNTLVQAELNQLAQRELNLGNTRLSNALVAFGRVFRRDAFGPGSRNLEARARDFLELQVRPWLGHPLIVEAVRRQNGETGGLTPERIAELDRRWQEETASSSLYLVQEVLDRPLSRYLKQIKGVSAGLYKEIFVMDAVGLIVGLSDPTSDYWQGDEAKWQQTYATGRDALHVGAMEFDDSSLSWQIQLSVPVLDPGSGEALGAITVGIDPAALGV